MLALFFIQASILLSAFSTVHGDLWCYDQVNITICDVPDPKQSARCFDQMFVFGDSLADTGNFATLESQQVYTRPNGVTWPGCYKGRACDGRLLTDYYAREFGLAYTRPWTACRCGTNFAVGNATALTADELRKNNVSVSASYSIRDQLTWYKRYLGTYECSRAKNGLYVVGIGGVDYLLAAQSGLKPDYIIQNIMPDVVRRIRYTIQVLSQYGGTNILVENLPPSGCAPRLITDLENTDEIDDDGCLEKFDRVIQAHNFRLNQVLNKELEVADNVIVAVEDRYSAFFEIWNNPSDYGMANRRVACCGGGGPYNFNPSLVCGMSGASVCDDPSKSVFWDSVHFSDHYNQVSSGLFLSGMFVNSTAGKNPFASMCT